MSEQQVEALASEYAAAAVETSRVGMTYLRVLVAGCQAIIGNKKRGRHAADAQAQVLNDVSAKFYGAVLRGVTTPDIAHDDTLPKPEQTRRSLERNRRSTFARSSKSTLAAYISAGGDLRGLEVETVTRDPLLKMVRETRGQSDDAHRMERARNSIIRIASKLAKVDLGGARADLEHTIEALQFALDGLLPDGNRVEAQIAAREQPDKRDRAPKDTSPLTMSGVIRTKPVHARMRPPTTSQGRAHA
jgi:hypothetical protein